ncbi:MAG: hypothetical protein HYZ93_02595 [Candidatus Omnitrophica bacterium]|nr:hypothetical protein [Candidatus Omnitrophota bacterium]
MTQRTFNLIAGSIFLIVALFHALRLAHHWEAVIGGWRIPVGLSWAALCLSGALSYLAFTRKP